MVLFLASLAGAADPEFSAGSYGRVNVSTDLEGGRGEAFNIVSHGPRLEQDPYAELDLGWHVTPEDAPRFDVLITPAIAGDVFHYDGSFEDAFALRNLYVQATQPIQQTDLVLWAGERMYRGDDVYLLDFWPLDEQNTWGGGAAVRPPHTEIAAHVGVNRLGADAVQFQTLTVTTPGGVAGQEVLVLDRQRTVASLKLSREVAISEGLTFRARVYGELHGLPAGRRAIEDPFAAPDFEILPDDRGSLVGAQLSLWGWSDDSFVHFWVRRETGLAVWDELVLPTTGLAPDLRAADARGWQVAWAGNQELGLAGIVVGGYWRDTSDADGQDFDFDDRTELALAFRPQVFPTAGTAFGIELSQQELRPRGLNPRTDTLVAPSVTKVSVMPALQAGRGAFARPRIHLIYTATLLDDDARSLYDPIDARVTDGAQHFVGIGAEWWVNSKSRSY